MEGLNGGTSITLNTWLCNFRHFNTKSKKFSVTVNFIQKETKKGSKKGNVIFSISRSFRPLSDDSRSFRKISEVFQGEIRKFSTTLWHEIFAGSNFCEFCDFSSDPRRNAKRVIYILEALRHNYMMPGLLPG